MSIIITVFFLFIALQRSIPAKRIGSCACKRNYMVFYDNITDLPYCKTVHRKRAPCLKDLSGEHTIWEKKLRKSAIEKIVNEFDRIPEMEERRILGNSSFSEFETSTSLVADTKLIPEQVYEIQNSLRSATTKGIKEIRKPVISNKKDFEQKRDNKKKQKKPLKQLPKKVNKKSNRIRGKNENKNKKELSRNRKQKFSRRFAYEPVEEMENTLRHILL
ncbi:hypothetical protein ILUMI_13934 [Ignelater luminosus]|uniref:Uncharacterized protein n=1 Tax=Ignelater luminosus TaxID=2038154 RepID=A0A8K0CRF1_IGNLU|nr:hypothetical protein ILUMI_13934 [Ignelater luminosus]